MLGQIPPQYLIVDQNCQAVLPNYVTQVTVSDNCEVASVVQTPAPGYILSAANQSVEVKIKATDVFGNFSEISFMVTAKDDKPPVITPTGDLIADNWNVINSMYDQAEQMLAEQEAFFDANFDWEAAGIPVELRPIDQFNTKMLLTWSYPRDNGRERLFTYVSKNDTFVTK